LLVIWGELVQAYCGKNKLGDVAEIYAYQLMPRDPRADAGQVDAQERRAALAVQSLHNILLKFSEDFNCAVYVDGGTRVYRKTWWHIKIVPK